MSARTGRCATHDLERTALKAAFGAIWGGMRSAMKRWTMMDRAFRSSRVALVRHRAVVAIDADWERVSASRPCPICGCDNACRRHVVDAFVCCARQPSDWPLTDGGWLHRVG